MFCKKCGANLPDNVKFCNTCGTAVTVTSQPVEEPATPSEPTIKVRKLKYLATVASKGVKATNIASWVVALLCAVFLVYSYITVYFSPLYDLPLLTTISEDAADEFKDEFDVLRDEYDEFREVVDELEDEEVLVELEDFLGTALDVDNADKILKRMDSFVEKPSLHNTNQFIKMFQDSDSEFFKELMSDDLLKVWDALLNGLIISCTAIILLTVLVALFKLTGFSVLAQFFAVIYSFLCGGPIPAIALFVSYIVLAVLCKIINSKYKDYRYMS